MILVVGASGYLGGLICRELQKAGRPVRAMVRQTSNVTYLKQLGVDLVYADLNDPTSLQAALKGCTGVIYTASAATPSRRGETVKGDADRANAMIDAARKAGVNRFVFISAVQPSSLGRKPVLLRSKLAVEEHLKRTGLDWTILRGALFMEVWMAMMGSSIPIRPMVPGLTHTLERPYRFTRWFYSTIRNDIEGKGVADINGDGKTKTSWLATADMARVAVASLDNPLCVRATMEVGTEPMTWLETVDVFSRVLGRQLRVKSTPVFMLRMMGAVLGLLAPAGGILVKASVMNALSDVVPNTALFRQVFPDMRLQTPEEFLRERLVTPVSPLQRAG